MSKMRALLLAYVADVQYLWWNIKYNRIRHAASALHMRHDRRLSAPQPTEQGQNDGDDMSDDKVLTGPQLDAQKAERNLSGVGLACFVTTEQQDRAFGDAWRMLSLSLRARVRELEDENARLRDGILKRREGD